MKQVKKYTLIIEAQYYEQSFILGHFAIAITVLMLVADVSFMIALTDAIVEPIANSVWYFILDKWWASKSKK